MTKRKKKYWEHDLRLSHTLNIEPEMLHLIGFQSSLNFGYSLNTCSHCVEEWQKRSTFEIMSATQPRSVTPYLCANRSPPNSWLCPGLCLNHTLQKDFWGILGKSFRFGPTSEILENIQYGGPSVVKSVILVWFLWRQDFNAGNKQFISLFCSYF